MKKILFVFSFAALFAACSNTTKCSENSVKNDTINVDSVQVDSILVDSVK